jgi:hypothetical protein
VPCVIRIDVNCIMPDTLDAWFGSIRSELDRSDCSEYYLSSVLFSHAVGVISLRMDREQNVFQQPLRRTAQKTLFQTYSIVCVSVTVVT